jgi:hypothetical protein
MPIRMLPRRADYEDIGRFRIVLPLAKQHVCHAPWREDLTNGNACGRMHG